MSSKVPNNQKYKSLNQSVHDQTDDLTSVSNTLLPDESNLDSTNTNNYKHNNRSNDNEIFNQDNNNYNSEEFELETLNNLDYEISIEEDDITTTASNTQTSSQDQGGSSNMKMAFMNMTNSILGAGIIGQPLAFKNSGLIGGIVVMIILTYLIDWTLILIVKNSILTNTKSYQDTVYKSFGMGGKIILLFSICSFAYGGCMAFCVIIGDTIPHVIRIFLPNSIVENNQWNWIISRNFIISIFTICISYPLSLNRDISKLAKASAFALLGMFIIVLLTLIRAPFVSSELRGDISISDFLINKNIFQGISVISFALVCHHNTMFIYQSISNKNLKKFKKLTHLSCIISMIFCMIMGINGFINFKSNTKGNILNNFKSNDNWINIARFCFGLNMLTTFPLEIFVVRDVIKEILLSKKAATQGLTSSDFELSKIQHFLITTFLVFSSMLVSLFTCNLGIILELIGATSASLMAYILPPLCYLKLNYKNLGGNWSKLDKQEKRNFLISKFLPCISCVIFGFAIMFISSGMTIMDAINNKDESDHCVVD
ncbi:uncharacterized protein KGF55_002248 [Candida pseudojiufengensis]|uniref:uncharacterized protein n=1 Tax=Candida pseudojiufengensis TaxID=497109 RepID=UPI002224379A|nr:uncharacterized protein KGF55_002248 [Candida pseudojiufengensis]KAI5964306.1 hypothetical protein KGF55_002248 [Candida pseudojiufengensis]